MKKRMVFFGYNGILRAAIAVFRIFCAHSVIFCGVSLISRAETSEKAELMLCFFAGTPDRSRTCDTWYRKPVLFH